MSEFDAVIVGAGQAGLGIGYHLQASGLSFVILERGEIGESWRSQRWDSFAVNTPNWINALPGSPYDGDDPDAFQLRDELVSTFERYAVEQDLPVRLGITVERVAADEDSGGFLIEAVDQGGVEETLHARNVVVASGMVQPLPRADLTEIFPDTVTHLRASDYRSAGMLPEGAVVVVGGGQSGCQIAEDLIEGGRTVFLCTSRVARVPRRYRGRDAVAWMSEVGMFDQRVEDLEDPLMQFAAQPQTSGVGPRGRTVSLQALQREGVHLMGRLVSVVEGVLTTDGGLADNIAFADAFSAEFKRKVDAYIEGHGLDAPDAEVDPADVPADPDVARRGLTTLDLDKAAVSAVIWCTGFRPNLGWLQVPVIDDTGRPVHTRGVSNVLGLYFLGFPWLHTRKSGIIYGVDEDARHIAETIGAIAR